MGLCQVCVHTEAVYTASFPVESVFFHGGVHSQSLVSEISVSSMGESQGSGDPSGASHNRLDVVPSL